MDRIIFPDTPSRDPVITQTSASPRMGRLSVDIRDVVKDSMYRDSRTPKEDGSGSGSGSGSGLTLKNNNDSLRPLHLGAGMKGNSMAADIKESLRVLAKLRDVELNYNEKEFLRLSYDLKEGSLFPIPNDALRYSYDGREINHKNKDIPRLSLDSRESEKYNVHQPPANQSRPSSVVAKLMGLDLLPDSKRAGEGKLGPIKMFSEERGPTLAPLRVPDSPRPVRLPKSPRSNRKESTSPRWRNSDGVMKPVSSSKFPIELAPWKHIDGSRVSPKQGSRQVKPTLSTSSTSPSVYGEIEKRLKDIEFKQSGKDLRALKQILEAMQAKGFLEGTKDEQSFTLGDGRDHDRRIGSAINGGGMSYNDFHTNRDVRSKQIRNGTPRSFESPIVIMKPAKLVQKSSIPASNIIPIEGLPALQRPQTSEGRKNSAISKIPKDQTIKEGRRDQPVNSSDKKTNNRKSRVTPTSSRSSQVSKDNNTTNSSRNPGSGSGSISPRLQQKKLEFDRRARPPAPPSDLNKSRRQPSKQSTESGSPGGRRRVVKTNIVQQNVDQSRVKCDDSRDLCSLEDSLSMHSDTNSSLEQRIERERTFTKQPVNGDVSQTTTKDQHWVSEEKEVSFLT